MVVHYMDNHKRIQVRYNSLFFKLDVGNDYKVINKCFHTPPHVRYKHLYEPLNY